MRPNKETTAAKPGKLRELPAANAPVMIAPVMTNRRFHIRAAGPQDGDMVARLCAALSAHEGAPPPAFTAEDFRRRACGPDALFSGLIAEQEGRPVGYALHKRDYDTDRLERCVHLLDLFVENTARGGGIGRALMASAAAAGKAYGATLAYWGVLQGNPLARDFYRRIGGIENSAMSLWGVDDEGFDRLCRRPLPAGVTMRQGTATDVPLLTRFLENLFADMDEPPPPEIGPRLMRDGFGPEPFFETLIAERGGDPLGYAMSWLTYETQEAESVIALSDLYVLPEGRGSGIGTALMGEVARCGRRRGAGGLWWPVLKSNERARRYYARFATEDSEALYCTLDGEAFQQLAASVPALCS
jgi:GNAT superfamily N-acetyltransferase